MARNGKIARMPAGIREGVNELLRDGRQAEQILAWLNGLPEAQKLLAEQFDSAPVNKQNLSDWRQGGYQDWLRHEEACDFLRELDDEADSFCDTTDERLVSDLTATRVAVELARVSQELLAKTTEPEERWARLQELLPHLAALRRADHRASRLSMAAEKHEWESEEHYRERALREFREKRIDELAAQRAEKLPLEAVTSKENCETVKASQA